MRGFFSSLNSFNLAASQAVSANINAGVSTVYNGSNLLYVGLPSMVGSSVGVGYLNTESYTLFAKFTLCHVCCTSMLIIKTNSPIMIAEERLKCKRNFQVFGKNCEKRKKCGLMFNWRW